MKTIAITGFALISLLACNPKNTESENSAPEEEIPSEILIDEHNSRNALDWPGVYKGTIPCADCEGIETRISLKGEGTFTRSVKYLGKDDNPVFDEGTFEWDESGSMVTLNPGKDNSQTYKVGENILFHLDTNGEVITGDLANKYLLQKNPTNPLLEKKHWMLTELMGQPVNSADLATEAFIEFDPETGRFSGNAGCNNFFGTYELMEGNRIRFSQAGSTMKACPDMSVEDQFLKILSQADNYNVSDSAFSLNKARMAPLARFSSER